MQEGIRTFAHLSSHKGVITAQPIESNQKAV